MFLAEFGVGFGIIGTDPQDGDISALVILVRIPESLGFFGTTGGVISGIEVDNEPLSPKVRQTNAISLKVTEAEVWGALTGRKGHKMSGFG